MLQWMGGSRRKVTTSRNSTYKRQKQYFEQKRRQIQHQTACLGSYSDGDGKGSCTPKCGNNTSLDILSLENISSLAHKDQTSCINEERDNSGHSDFTQNHEDAHASLVILTNKGISVDQSEIDLERTPSSYIVEDEYSKKGLIHLPDRDKVIAGNHIKHDSFKLSPTHPISVIDLLSDDGGTNNYPDENSLQQEAHVAFSVEGLGKVEMETPVHSPKIPGRYFQNCFSPPKKARRQSITTKHLDFDTHDMGSGVETDFSPYDISVGQPSSSRDVMNVVASPTHKLQSFIRPAPYNWNGCDLQGVFKNNELICNIGDCGRNTWNGPSFLDDNIDDFGECESFSKKWVDQRDIGFDDYFHRKDHWKQDLNFECWDPWDKRSSSKRTEILDMKGPPFPYPKHQPVEELPGVAFSDKIWCSTIGIDNNSKATANHFVREETTDSLSLVSEESCSSTAVRGGAIKKE